MYIITLANLLLRLGFAGGDETGQTAGDVRAWRNLVSDLPAGLANGHGRDQRDRWLVVEIRGPGRAMPPNITAKKFILATLLG